MSQHCRANPCCGDRPCSGIPLPQDASGLPAHNKRVSFPSGSSNPMTIETELPAVKVGDGMAFFTANVDRWGAAEWFDRLAKAIREQDNAVRAKDDISFEIFRSIAASSAMTLVREFEEQVRSALTLKDDPGKRSEADGE